MTNWEAIAALEAKKREYMDCPHGASNQACCVFCITTQEPPLRLETREGMNPVERLLADASEPPGEEGT